MAKRNIYNHEIDLLKLRIRNSSSKDFAAAIEQIPYRGYEVEDISDGRKIVIAKPGGKQSYGRLSKEDFFVFIHDPRSGTLWQITHKEIYEDLVEKSRSNKTEAIKLLQALERVYGGEEPEAVLEATRIGYSVGEPPEVILKAYKWIWGQEDVNYPTGKGRAMSWEGWENTTTKSGTGLKDLLLKLVASDNTRCEC